MWPSGPGSPGGGEFQLASPGRQLGLLDGCPQTSCWWPCLQACTGVWKSLPNSLRGQTPLKARGGPGNHAGSGTTGMTVRSAHEALPSRPYRVLKASSRLSGCVSLTWRPCESQLGKQHCRLVKCSQRACAAQWGPRVLMEMGETTPAVSTGLPGALLQATLCLVAPGQGRLPSQQAGSQGVTFNGPWQMGGRGEARLVPRSRS